VESYDPTIEDSYRKQISVDKKACMLDILDTAGQEMYSAYQDKYFQSGAGFVVVYSIIERDSFDKIGKYFDRIRKAKDREDIPIILVANKIDLPSQRQISTEEGQEKAKSFSCFFHESSAKTKEGIDELFKQLVRLIRKDQKANGIKEKKACSLL